MKVLNWSLGVVIGLGMVLGGCNSEKEGKSSSPSQALFEKVPIEESGLDFVNVMEESDSVNILSYEYIYNGSGVAVGDVNNDGLQDMFFSSNDGKCKLYMNKGDLKFEDVTEKAGITTSYFCIGTSMADVNNDGFLDIYVCRSNPFFSKKNRENLLFINQGDATFKEMGEEYGINDFGHSSMANFFDMDNDGDLDLFVGNHPMDFVSDIREHNIFQKYEEEASDHMYENLGNGKFKDITDAAGMGSFAFALSVTTSDFNNDGLTDVYVCNDYYGPDFCYINLGNGKFKESQQSMFKHTSSNAMGSDAADFNNDGLIDFIVLDMLPEDNYRRKVLMGPANFDLYITRWNRGYGHQSMKNTLQLNQGNGKFSEIACYSGITATDWSWAPLFADYDNDGWKDIYITNGYYRDVTDMDFVSYAANFMKKNNRALRSDELAAKLPNKKTNNYAYRNNKDLTFEDVSSSWGLDDATVSNGAAYADFDNDGDLDLITCNINSPVHLYENKSSNSSYLQVELKGEQTNKFGLGVKAKLHTNNGIQYAENFTTRGYNSSVWPIVHFGLGDSEIEKLELFWPSGKYTVINKPAKNTRLKISEADALPSVPSANEAEDAKYFEEIAAEYGIEVRHNESGFVDFKREPLIPRMYSKIGPDISVADVNQDGLEDFIISGSTISQPKMYLQTTGGKFTLKSGPWSAVDGTEENAILFFDANGDKFPDLYLGNGSNEYGNPNDEHYADQLYINNNGSFVLAADALPGIKMNTACVVPEDMDGDGDLDLFIGGSVRPGYYPQAYPSVVLSNDGGKFTDVTATWMPALAKAPLISQATFADLDGDKKNELILAGDWMPITVFKSDGNSWNDVTSSLGLADALGWWKTVETGDFDNDGDIDMIAGNEGLNSQYLASPDKPIVVDFGDLDDNGRFDAVVSQYYGNVLAPIYSKAELEEQLRYFMNTNYKFHVDYAATNTRGILAKANEVKGRLEVNELRSMYFENTGSGFKASPLPPQMQFSPIFAFHPMDVNNDGNLDVLVAGNSFDNKIELGWVDAMNGAVLLGDGKGGLTESVNTGFFVPENPKRIKTITINGNTHFLVTNNNSMLQVFKQLKPKSVL